MRYCTIKLYCWLIRLSRKHQSSLLEQNWRNNRRQPVTKATCSQGHHNVNPVYIHHRKLYPLSILCADLFFKHSSCLKICPPSLRSFFCKVLTRSKRSNTCCSHYKEIFSSTLASAFVERIDKQRFLNLTHPV